MNDAASSISTRGAGDLARWHLLALGADAAVVVAAIVIASRVGLKSGDVPNIGVLAIGWAMSMVSVTAVWLALGPLAFSGRIIGAPLMCLSALSSMTLLLALTGANLQAVIGTFVAGLAQFVLLQASYWLIRSWQCLQVAPIEELPASGPIERLQYSLWQMLLVMTVIAATLGIGRVVFGFLRRVEPSGGELVLAIFLAILVAYDLLITWPLVWAALSLSQIKWKIALAIVLTILTVAAAYPLTIALLGPGEGRWIYWLVFAPQPAYLLAHLFATPASGYRLVQLV